MARTSAVCTISVAVGGSQKNMIAADFRLVNHKLVFLFLFLQLCRENGHMVTQPL